MVKDVVAVKRESDILYQVKENGYQYLMAIEMQTYPDSNMPSRILEYTAMQHRAFKKPVYPVVINLTGSPQQDIYSFECLDLTVVNFSYKLINLSDLPGQKFLRQCPVGLIPLVPLMRHEEPPEEILLKCAKRIEELPVEMQSDLYLGLALFASLRFARELILRYIEVGKMENSTLFDGIRDKWIDQGRRQGIEQGIKNERMTAILEDLKDNLGSYPEDLVRILQSIDDLELLKTLRRYALRVKSTDEFIKAMEDLKR